ncbi:MAG: disulfide bond formation protein DsbA [Piscirickettsiaceae bacterium]|nr:MAG: disulfide bond formation protein DsbA [Piscirickettsiaceae bacterium]PCH85655.1 MAG: disulfide bond formation protein DsbA [Piscirickettsiaceae bacterium]
MRKLTILLTLLLLPLGNAVFANESVEYDEGIDYKLITPAQATDDPDRIEVVEVFWYGCPHCNHFEPSLGPWVKNAPKDVNFYRLPAIFAQAWEVHARAYFTADILDVLEKSHRALFHALHTEHKSLNTVDKLAAFYANYGIDEELFKKTYNSFVVNTRVSRSKDMVNRYGITGVPAVVIEGKYLVTGPMAKSYQNMLKITDYLVEKERRLKK